MTHPPSRLCLSDLRRSVPYKYRALHPLACLPHCVASDPLRVPQASALPTASFRSPVTRGTLAAQLTLPPAGCVQDFHLQVSAPCRAHQRKGPNTFVLGPSCMRSLAVTYSGMACSHTTIGAGRFHFRVRNGIGWFPLAIAARQTGKLFVRTLVAFANASDQGPKESASMHHPLGYKRLEVIWSSLTGN